MRILALAPVILALAACDMPMTGMQGGGSRANVATTPFTWKANTPLATRGYDINQCELAGRGLGIEASQAEIAEASARLDDGTIAARVRSCLQTKGYTLTEKPVCSTTDYARGNFIRRPEVLPPLESIICVDPAAGGFISTVTA